MEFLECEICKNYFNSQERKPRTVSCGHTFCSLCLQSFLHKKNIVGCPCSREFLEQVESVEKIMINWQIAKSLELIELNCINHADKLAVSLNIDKAEAYCETCGNGLLIPFENFTDSLTVSLNEISHLAVSEVAQKKFQSVRLMSNKEKLILLKNTKSILDRIVCDNHNSDEALWLNLNTKDLFCEGCVGANKESFSKIDQPEFNQKLITKITWVRRAADKIENGILSSSLDEIKNASTKDLVYAFKNLKQAQKPVFLKNARCGKCKELFNANRKKAWIFTCIGGHTICEECKGQEATIICPVDKSVHASNTLEIFFSDNNSIPFCSICQDPFDLKKKIPKELPCGHILCLTCFKAKHLDPVTNNECLYCSTQIPNLKGVPTSQFLVQQISNNLVYCSRHRNKLAVCIETITLQSYCKKCGELQASDKVHLNPSVQISLFLIKKFVEKNANEGFRKQVGLDLAHFKTLTCQEMIDKLREGSDANCKEKLRSSVPKGQTLLDKDQKWGTNAVLTRFFSVMPPEGEPNPIFEFVCKPWVVESSENQVEAVVVRVTRNIILVGLIIGQSLNSSEIRLGLVKIIKGKCLNDETGVVYTNQVVTPFDKDGIHQTIYMEQGVGLSKDEFYSILLKINGDGVLMHRGNPFDLKEEFFGSDGTQFEFFEPDEIGDYSVNGQHDINGPILGLIYQ